jgi:hypothetical protein
MRHRVNIAIWCWSLSMFFFCIYLSVCWAMMSGRRGVICSTATWGLLASRHTPLLCCSIASFFAADLCDIRKKILYVCVCLCVCVCVCQLMFLLSIFFLVFPVWCVLLWQALARYILACKKKFLCYWSDL